MTMTMTMPSDVTAREKTTDLTANLIVQAPAGSGKTTELTKRFLTCLSVSENPEEVVAITFTNKATAEMQDRILEALVQAMDDTPPESEHERGLWSLGRKVLARDQEFGWRLLDNTSRLRIMTFDKLCAYLSTQLPVLSGVGTGMQIEENPEVLYREAILALFDEFEQSHIEPEVQQALEYLLRFTGNRLDRLIPLLSTLLAKRDQWIEVIGTEDMGMERALETYIVGTLTQAHRGIPLDVQCELAAILKDNAHHDRLKWAADLDVWPTPTVNNLGLWRDLASFLLTNDGTLIKRVTVTIGFPAKEANTERMKALLADLHENDPDVLARPMKAVRRLPDPDFPAEMAEFREALSIALIRLTGYLKVIFSERGKVDFVEVAQRALEALQETRDWMTEEDSSEDNRPSEVLQRLDHVIKHILVDEVQDTSRTQIQLLQHLTSGWQPGEGRSLFFVGDPMQSIYAFRQAEVRLFMAMWENRRLHNHLMLEPVSLTNNFRSGAPLIQWFNDAFADIFPAEPDPYTSAVTFAPSDTLCDSTEGGVVVHPQIGADLSAEAQKVVGIVQQAQADDPEGTIAVLVRSRTHVIEIVRAFKHAGITYAAQDIDTITSTSPVNDVIQLVHALRQIQDRTAWFHLLRAPFVGVGWDDMPAISMITGHRAVVAGLKEIIDTNSPSISEDGKNRITRLLKVYEEVNHTPSLREDIALAVEAIWYGLGGDRCVTDPQHKDVETLLSLLKSYCHAGQLKDIDAFGIAVQKLYATPEAGTVQIMTVHKSKGLEFDTVILPGLGKMPRRDDPPMFRLQSLPDGFVVAPSPIREMRKEDSPGKRLYDAMGSLFGLSQVNERVRLLYVAATRAKKHLHLLGHASENSSGIRAASGSMLELLWPAVKDQYEACVGQIASSVTDPHPISTYRVPALRRLPEGVEVQASQPICAPKYDRHIRPSELLVRQDTTDPDGDPRRMVGKIYHEIMDKIARQGLAAWPVTRVEALRQGIQSRLLQGGSPLPLAEPATDRIIRLVTATIESDTGRWILGHWERAYSEWALSGYLDDAWVAARIDRVMVDADTVWLVDYKTSEVSTEELPELVDQYRPTMTLYARMVQTLYPDKTVKSVLFLPETGELLAA